MKKRKFRMLTLSLAACAVIAASAAGSAAGTPLSGGWAAAEDPAITEDVQDMLEQATEGYVGAEFEPVALLATQVVAGTNYCLLCKSTPVVPDPQPSYVYVYIYQDLTGNAKILEVQDITFGIGESDDDADLTGEEYRITISEDTDPFMVQECPETAKAGETVTVCTACVTDAYLYASVDGDTEYGSFVEEGLYEFVMPDHDVEISVWAVGNGLA